MANPIKILGKGIVYLGLAAMFLMAVIGTFSLDLLFLWLISQPHNTRNRDSNFILTLWAWNMMLSNHSSFYENIGYSLLASPFISAISIGLSIAVGSPEFGLLLLAGWVGAFTIILVGAVIYGLGDALEYEFSNMVRRPVYREEDSFTTSNRKINKQFGSAPQHQQTLGKAAANEMHYDSPLNTGRQARVPSAPTKEEAPPSYQESQEEAGSVAKI